MPGPEKVSVKIQITDLYGQLKPLYNNPEENSDKIQGLKSKIHELTAQLRAEEEAKGLVYSEKEGVFRKPEEKEKAERHIASLRQGEADPRKKQEIEDLEWKEENLRDDISGQQWYNNIQAEGLTGGKVPVGGPELSQHLMAIKAGKKPAGSFSYLMTPDESNPTLNHFVSINVKKEGDNFKVTYLDSNGDLMEKADRGIITKVFGDKAKVAYRDHDGKEIDEQAAQEQPLSVLRVQFDSYNCGMYSTEATNMMNKAQGNEVAIQEGLRALKEIDPQAKRQEHMQKLEVEAIKVAAKRQGISQGAEARKSSLAESVAAAASRPRGRV